MRLGAGQDLVDDEQPVEPAARYPFLLVDQIAPDHGDLRHRPAPGHQPEAQEAPENLERGEPWRLGGVV